jgi:hypothetical protein
LGRKGLAAVATIASPETKSLMIRMERENTWGYVVTVGADSDPD